MANMNWKVLLHTTDGERVTYTLSRYQWKSDTRIGGGFIVMSTCLPEELPAVLESCGQMILQDGPWQLQLPLELDGPTLRS